MLYQIFLYQRCRYETVLLMLAGHDSRFAMEQNLGSTQVGVQKSGWLYQQTKTLVEDFKVKLTLSGDQPFVMRLVNGDNVEDDSKCAIYVGKKSSIGFDVKDGKKVFQPFCQRQLIPKRRNGQRWIYPGRYYRQLPWFILTTSEEFALTLAMVSQEWLRMTCKSFVIY